MNKFIYTAICYLFTVSYCFAQNITLPLWQEHIPNHKKTEATEKVTSTDIIRISHVQIPDIAVFLPSRKNASGQAVVICPGGGYVYLSYDLEGTDVAKWLNGNGIAAIVLKYRLPDDNSNVIPYKSPLLDAKRAIRLVRYHAEEWNIDSNKIGIMGFSAGGHLASTLGTHFDYGLSESEDSIDKLSCRPAFMILAYPVISMDSSITHKGSLYALLGENPEPKLIEIFSNELQVKEDTPPAFIIHATDDHAVPVENSLRFYKALKVKNIPVEMHLYPEGGHGFSLALKNEHLSSWTCCCIRWLKWIDE